MTKKDYRGRREDARLLSGAGKFTSDIDLANHCHGVFLRSDRAHAEIISVDIEAALGAPGVIAVLTGADTAKVGFGPGPQHVKYLGRNGMKIRIPNRPVLAQERVRHVGQEVALVIAESSVEAQDAAEKIEVQYRDLPVIVDADEALAANATQLYPDIEGNLCFDYEYGDEARVVDAFAHADTIVQLTLDSQRVIGHPMEPKACVAAYHPEGDVYEIYVPSQGMPGMLAGLTTITGIPESNIRIRTLDVGGGFGIRTDAYSEYCALMLAARVVGRPIKWTSSRAEGFLSDYHGRAAKLSGQLALDREGRFTGLRIAWVVNCGAYLSAPGPLINTLLPTLHAVGAYRIPHVYGRHRLALTNTTPTIAYRGAGRPNVIYLLERLVDEAACKARIDRIELRRRNLIPRDAFPYRTPLGSIYDSGDPGGLLDDMVESGEWTDFPSRRAESERRNRLRGIGCAVFIEPSGAGRAPVEEVMITFNDTGNVIVFSLSGSTGQGHETVFPQIVADVLGIDATKVTLRASDPDGPKLIGEGTMASRSTISHGGALLVAAREVIRKGAEIAAQELEVATGDLEFQRGLYRVPGTDLAIGITDLAKKHASRLDSVGAIPLPQAFPGGAHMAEVELDPETGEIELLRYVAVSDCGRIINPVLAEGQLHGGIAQGIGQAMSEHCVYDAEGQMVTGSLMDYALPRADQMPEPRLFDHSVRSPNNPLGAKGIGESGTTGALATIANAVIDALRPLEIRHLDFPFTAARIWRAIRSAAVAQDQAQPPGRR